MVLVVLGVRTFLSAFRVRAGLEVGDDVVRRAVGPRTVQLADGVAGLGLTTFGGVLGYRTLTRSP